MLTKRIIPCLDVDGGRVVKGISFIEIRDAGDPTELAAYYDAEGADELVLLDITASSDSREIMLDIVRQVAERLFIPFTVGGGMRSAADVRRMLEAGADKVSLNTAAVGDPSLVAEASERFGSQCIVVAIDAAAVNPGSGRGARRVRRPVFGARRRFALGSLYARRQNADGDRRAQVGESRRRAGRGRAAGHEHGHGRTPNGLRPRDGAPHIRDGRGPSNSQRRRGDAGAFSGGAPNGEGGRGSGGERVPLRDLPGEGYKGFSEWAGVLVRPME